VCNERPPAPCGLAVTVSKPFGPQDLSGGSICELRADLWPGGPREALRFTERSPLPVLFTCRLAREGGAFRGPEPERLAIFEKALEKGARWVDIEASSRALADALAHKWPVLVSVHLFERFFTDISEAFRKLSHLPVTAIKLVATAQSPHDLLKINRFLRSAPDPPAAVFAMGDIGIPSRLLALQWGSCLTYAAAGTKVAPGQLALPEITGTYGDLTGLKDYVALTGLETPELLKVARLFNQAAERASPPAVPFPHVPPEFEPLTITELQASAVLRIVKKKSPGKQKFEAFIRTESEPNLSVRPSGIQASSLIELLNGLLSELS